MKIFISADNTGDISMVEVTTKYGKYRIYEEKNGELDILKLEPFSINQPMIIKPIVSNRITIK